MQGYHTLATARKGPRVVSDSTLGDSGPERPIIHLPIPAPTCGLMATAPACLLAIPVVAGLLLLASPKLGAVIQRNVQAEVHDHMSGVWASYLWLFQAGAQGNELSALRRCAEDRVVYVRGSSWSATKKLAVSTKRGFFLRVSLE